MIILSFSPVKPGRQTHMYEKLLLTQFNVLLAIQGPDTHGSNEIAQVGPVNMFEQIH